MNDHSILLQIFSKQRENQYRVAGSDAEQRIAKLKKLRHYLLDHLNEACEATRQDFSKPEAETIIGELLVLISEISYSIKNLKRWMRPERQSVPLTMLGTSSHIQYEAKGCVLIIAPWNYPIALSLKPLVSAVSAGCVAIIKPSEMTPHASAFIRKVVENVFSIDEVAVIDGDANISTELLKLPFNHIFFTGSPAVGKIVMKAAAENLTSVTLELGGKSPSIVDETADISETAKRIVWAKFFNNGQTCIAPDYVLVQESVSEKLVTEMKNAIRDMYNDSGNGIERSTSFARIVNEKHFNRLSGLLDEASAQGAIISEGGTRNASERYIAPTIMTEVTNGMRIMQEEIFGPILPVLRFKNLSDAIDHVNAGEKPLALYIHSENAANTDRILHSTSSGNALVNEVLTQFGNTEIPFGGINNSGIGKSNGFYGFKEFSNAKGVMKRRFGTMKFLYPPYSERLVGLLKKGLKWI
jgi:aldehyde dehydrogenase (NAD+)